ILLSPGTSAYAAVAGELRGASPANNHAPAAAPKLDAIALPAAPAGLRGLELPSAAERSAAVPQAASAAGANADAAQSLAPASEAEARRFEQAGATIRETTADWTRPRVETETGVAGTLSAPAPLARAEGPRARSRTHIAFGSVASARSRPSAV